MLNSLFRSALKDLVQYWTHVICLFFCAHLSNNQICSCKLHHSEMLSKDVFKVLGNILTTHIPVLVMDHLQANLQIGL